MLFTIYEKTKKQNALCELHKIHWKLLITQRERITVCVANKLTELIDQCSRQMFQMQKIQFFSHLHGMFETNFAS